LRKDFAPQQLLLNWFEQEDQEDIADRLKVLERRAQCEQLYRQVVSRPWVFPLSSLSLNIQILRFIEAHNGPVGSGAEPVTCKQKAQRSLTLLSFEFGDIWE
jgi:hypothetical protein